MSKVIIVDDEPFILMMVRDKLERAGLEVVTLKESVGALEVIRAERPDLIILDWMMPELSGIDLCRLIKADSELKGITVLMLSAKGQQEDEEVGLVAGVSRYITKPFSPRVLLEIVEKELEK